MSEFPSIDHRAELVARCRKTGLSAMPAYDRQFYHAYDYAWRRVVLSTTDDRSPIDDDRKWFDRWLVDQAEAFWRRHLNRPAAASERKAPRRITPADEAEAAGDHEQAERFREQDRERPALQADIVGDGRLASGEPGPELTAYFACCRRQVAANVAAFTARQPKRNHDRDREALRRVRDSLGVRVTAQPEAADG